MTLVIYGAGGFAREVQSWTGGVLCAKEDEPDEQPDVGVIAIGSPNARRYEAMRRNPKEWGILMHRSVIADGSSIWVADGTILCAGTILTTDIRIGHHCIVNLGCTIGHDAVLEDFVSLMPGVHISGNVTVGKRTFIGTGAVVREGVRIGEDVVVGAGACVVKDVADGLTVVGVPARSLK